MFNGLNILYAEDEEFARQSTVEVLEFMYINVTAVSNGKEAYEEYLKNRPDIIITDIEMPQMNGLELIEKIRKTDNETQIIITSAYTNTEYFLKAVELNLVKYVLKPITLIDLKDALLACSKNIEKKSSVVKLDESSCYDLKLHKFTVNKSEQKLDHNERNFLELLLKYPNQVVPYEQIEATIWEDGMSSAALRSLVRNLRQKLPENLIQNISKTGYKIVIND